MFARETGSARTFNLTDYRQPDEKAHGIGEFYYHASYNVTLWCLRTFLIKQFLLLSLIVL